MDQGGWKLPVAGGPSWGRARVDEFAKKTPFGHRTTEPRPERISKAVEPAFTICCWGCCSSLPREGRHQKKARGWSTLETGDQSPKVRRAKRTEFRRVEGRRDRGPFQKKGTFENEKPVGRGPQRRRKEGSAALRLPRKKPPPRFISYLLQCGEAARGGEGGLTKDQEGDQGGLDRRRPPSLIKRLIQEAIPGG